MGKKAHPVSPPSNLAPPKFDELTLDKLTLEIRYDLAPLLWDCAGSMWTEIRANIPGLKVVQAQPSVSAFKLENRYDFNVLTDRAFITAKSPKPGLDEFADYANKFFEPVFHQLEVTEFTRVGMRFQYIKTYATRSAASSATLELGLWRTMGGKHFGIEGTIISPEYRICLEDASHGVSAYFAAKTETLDHQLGSNIDVEKIHKERHQFMYDLDYYAISPVRREQLKIKPWIEQINHVVHRDSNTFFKK